MPDPPAEERETAMAELILVGFVGLLLMAVFGVFAAVFSLLWWVITLPFRLLAFTFKGLAALLVLPFLVIFAVLGGLLFGAGVLAFAVPALPFLLIGLVLWALLRKRDRSSATMA